MDDLTRRVLHFASVLGHSFEVREIIDIAEHILCVPSEEKAQLAHDIDAALQTAVAEGILDEMVRIHDADEDDECDKIKLMTIQCDSNECDEKEIDTRRVYSFYHSTWQRLILSLLLDSWKRDIHEHAAMAIEARLPNTEQRDYRIKVKLFQHWKESENTVKAADLALDIGQSYKLLGLNQQSIKVYEDALDMWRKDQPAEGEELIAGKCFERL